MRSRQRPAAALARRSRRGSARARSPATAWSAPPARSTAGRSPATRRTARSSAARSASATPTRSCGCSRRRRARGSPSSRSSSRAARGCRRAPRRSAGYGRIFRETVALTGVVPQISVVSGASAGGGAYSPALTDLIVMTEDAAMFLTGPGVVREALGEEIDAVELGGPRVHDHNGVCHLVERDELQRGGARARAARPICRRRPASRRRGRGRSRPSSPIPARSSRPSRAASTTCATRCAGSSTAARCSSCARAGRATSSRRSPGSTAARSGSSPTSRAISAGVLDAEGSEKAARFVVVLRLVRAAADRGGRHARVHARLDARSRPA